MVGCMGSGSRRAIVATGAALSVALGSVFLAGVFLEPTQATAVQPRAATTTVLAWREAAPSKLTIGTSTSGRPIVAIRQGPADAPNVLLVLGQMHGSEPRGRDVVREVRRLKFPAGVQVWTISSMNPDGGVAGTRTNAHGVDLNRNFPFQWRANPRSHTYYPGRRPASEPETAAMLTFLNELRPDVILSFHQAFRAIDVGPAKASSWAGIMSARTNLPIHKIPCHGPCSGTMTGWFNANFTGSAITVELPRNVSLVQAQIYARAVGAVAAALANQSTPASPTPSSSVSASVTPTTSVTPAPSVTP